MPSVEGGDLFRVKANIFPSFDVVSMSALRTVAALDNSLSALSRLKLGRDSAQLQLYILSLIYRFFKKTSLTCFRSLSPLGQLRVVGMVVSVLL